MANESTDEIKEIEVKREKKKASKNILDEKDRLNILETLKDAGIDTTGLSDIELVNKLQDAVGQVKKLQEDLFNASQSKSDEEKSVLAKQLTSYINTHDSQLTDKAFVARLFEMGVPAVFLKLFRDHDSNFTKSKIWEVIRHSGIKTYKKSLSEILSKRRPFNRIVDHNPYA